MKTLRGFAKLHILINSQNRIQAQAVCFQNPQCKVPRSQTALILKPAQPLPNCITWVISPTRIFLKQAKYLFYRISRRYNQFLTHSEYSLYAGSFPFGKSHHPLHMGKNTRHYTQGLMNFQFNKSIATQMGDISLQTLISSTLDFL